MADNLALILSAEQIAREHLNDLRVRREQIDAECQSVIADLNRLKREAYRLGFKGNVMRGPDGGRVDSLPTIETRTA